MRDETRKATCKLLEMIADGILDRDAVINACLKYMSEADVADMAHINGFIDEDEDEDEDPDTTDSDEEDPS